MTGGAEGEGGTSHGLFVLPDGRPGPDRAGRPRRLAGGAPAGCRAELRPGEGHLSLLNERLGSVLDDLVSAARSRTR